ncbi:Abnormal cell lineage protein 44, variant 2 [Globodera pallida]|nr:Abnormal cell lineage protein 44, variant 2 [Globodera pallida]
MILAVTITRHLAKFERHPIFHFFPMLLLIIMTTNSNCEPHFGQIQLKEMLQSRQHQHKTFRKPEKLLRGCPRELLQLKSFRQFPLVCRVQPALAVVAYEGIMDAMDECRQQMRFEPWDCSQPATVLHEPTIIKNAYRESAYLWAMSAAGLAWGVATACAQGWLDECKCVGEDGGQSIMPFRPTTDWEWSGCSYGVHYGVITARKMLTRSVVGGKSTRTVLSRRHLLRKLEKHNLKVGRMAVKRTLTSSCRCHGVSGSCQQKTCWKKAADLPAIAQHLAQKYKSAKFVVSARPDEEIRAKNTELVFLERSVDLCSQFHYDVHQKRSLPRICSWRNATHSEGDCSDLCCGLGYSVSIKYLIMSSNSHKYWIN